VTREIRDERNHARDGEQQRGIVAHERCRGYDRVAVLCEVIEPAFGDLGGLHCGLLALTQFGVTRAVSVDDGFFHTRNSGIYVGKKRLTGFGLAHLMSDDESRNDTQRNQKNVLHKAQV